ncbi:unnamed protein product [Rotaria sp. Silwood2]|nr:unnamed protein product [Rotaria sp. Silwood2]CAF2944326.1 unnamed protein product [Rotaria sp. Silwood2]CAF3521469.1 unnamed protein product [Rotaria sp. Silwood2]CAF4050281.1 unnamed protein product [Rotaria sp. Silwood2]CAF4815190.1 unnamed protein product [Rotaria sp. Silwood2]
MIIIIVALLSRSNAQSNQCTPAAIATCGTFPCVQTGNTFSCLCPDMTTKPSAIECDGGLVTTTQPSVVIPNQCTNAVCPAGATCIPTNQNPSLYICLCPNNIIANPDCPINPLPNNPCLINNPCQNGATCVVNQLTLQAVCVCPENTYGPNCSHPCRPACDSSWCYNGGRCVNGYGHPYCFCGYNYRGRRCELRYNTLNYVYLYYHPRW